MARLCTSGGIAKINNSNVKTVEKLFTESVGAADEPPPSPQGYHLPGDVCRTIKKARKGAGAGPHADTLDGWIDLVKLGIGEINDGIRRLFDLLFRACLPSEVDHFMSDSYLFLLFKDPEDRSKLRPIAIPCAVRRLLASHVVAMERIHAMQLSIDKFIRGPEESVEELSAEDRLPTRAAVFVDFRNMFNMVSRKVLLKVLRRKYPHLVPLAWMLYRRPGRIHYRWEDGEWRLVNMEEGCNQGCPLSVLFSSLVLQEVLVPMDHELRERAAAMLAGGDEGDDGYGSITHLFAWVDDVCGCVPLADLAFFFDFLEDEGPKMGWHPERLKSHVLTSCTEKSVLP
ncbi:hypothetical protein ACHAWF_012529 [Thalassiosira exigua]